MKMVGQIGSQDDVKPTDEDIKAAIDGEKFSVVLLTNYNAMKT